jgi:GNAT superfamily N-acetyltransferase
MEVSMTAAITQKSDEVSESIDQWVRFCSTGPNPALGGEIIREPGLTITCCRTLWPMGNLAIFTAPVESIEDLEHRTETAHKCLSDRDCRGVFFVAESLVVSSRSIMPDVFARYGYASAMTVMGMATDALAAPVRPLPPLRYGTVTDSASRRAVGELNAIAYEVPPEWGQDYNERTDIWSHGAFGVIGYLNERPAACAVTVPLDGRLYMALVATAHEFRRLGCAEAVMRRSLEDAARATGLTRTVLHASPMGRPLYSQMGYHDTVPFALYAQAEVT